MSKLEKLEGTVMVIILLVLLGIVANEFYPRKPVPVSATIQRIPGGSCLVVRSQGELSSSCVPYTGAWPTQGEPHEKILEAPVPAK